MKKRTEITIETDRLLVVNHRRRNLTAWCEACRMEVRMVTVDEAAARINVPSLAIYHRVETGGLHFTETSDGLLLICFNSLLRIHDDTTARAPK